MVDSCFSVGAFCVCGALITLVLKQYCSEYSITVSVAVCVLVLGAFAAMLGETVSELDDMMRDSGVSESYIAIVFKTITICFITHIASELCRDSGENAMASAAELWGRGAIAAISMPLFGDMIGMLDKLM